MLKISALADGQRGSRFFFIVNYWIFIRGPGKWKFRFSKTTLN